MSEITQALLTSSLTVCSGVLVLVVGQIIIQFVIEPIQNLKKLIGEIGDALVFYANVYSNPGVAPDEENQEVSKTLRQKASLLRARSQVVPFYWLFTLLCFVPSKKRISIASSELIGLSNSVHKGDPMLNGERAEKIRSALRLPNYD